MIDKRILTGITTTGTPHLGNYVGAIRPAVRFHQRDRHDNFFFLADYHALVKCRDPNEVRQSTQAVAATWLACGLDPEHCFFYRQSDIPEIMELCWILTCVTAKGLLNRAHAYKAAVQMNIKRHEDPDKAVTMGLFSYPILMAADILTFNATDVPVGRDQVQHIEMTRDIAQAFNHQVQASIFTLPEAITGGNTVLIKGLDGRKMSKSYHNTIPLFGPAKSLQKSINKIQTNSLLPGEPKSTDDCAVFDLWQAFANTEQEAWMREQFDRGIAWGEVKKELFHLVNNELQEARKHYDQLILDHAFIEQVLHKGAQKARHYAANLLAQVKQAVGIYSTEVNKGPVA